MQGLARWASIVFGLMVLALSVAVGVETLVRKLFSISLGGVDELSGYAIAIGAPLAFTVALIERAHIRIDVVFRLMPGRLRTALNWLSIMSIAALATFLLAYCYVSFSETLAYRSVAQTPWATPLYIPESAWLAATAVFCVTAVALAIRATALLLTGRGAALDREFGPVTAEEELESELADVARR